MRRIGDWLAKFSVLEIAAADHNTGGATMVTIRRFPGGVRLGTIAFAVAYFGYLAWAFFTEATFQPASVSIVFVILFVRLSHANRIQLTDDVLAHAAAWAAMKRGRQIKPGRWRLKGVEAEAIGAELARLHTWRTNTGAPTGVERLRERERILLEDATGPLRDYLQPVLTATGSDPEPLQVESASHIPGESWPTLSRPEPEWPVLSVPEEGRPS